MVLLNLDRHDRKLPLMATVLLLLGSLIFINCKSNSLSSGTDSGTPYIASITVTDLQTVKGFGCCPVWAGNYDITNYPLAQQVTYEIGASIIRHVQLPGLGNGNGNLNTAEANKLCGAIQLTVSKGLPYVISSWSPPAGMKTIEIDGSVDAGNNPAHLRTDKEQTLCNFVVNIMNYIKEQGLTLPMAYSLQNEPTCQTPWAGCIYDADQYQRVVKLLRTTLDNAGYSDIMLLGPEDGAYYNADTWNNSVMFLGGSGFPALNDADLNRAIGAFAGHSYDWGPEYSTIAHLNAWAEGCERWGKDRWMTEYCYGDNQYPIKIYSDNSHMLGTTRRFISDMVFIKNNYWFTWAVYDLSDDPSALTFGDGKNSLTIRPTYYVLKKLFSSIAVGSKVRCMTTTDKGLESANGANMNMAAFVNGTNMTAVIVNPTITARKTTIKGLTGSSALIYQIATKDYNIDMSLIGSPIIKGDSISGTNLPPNSITIIVTK